ncbi:MAG: hypothetical protein U0104_15200 [Gemmatimonadales bacterium]
MRKLVPLLLGLALPIVGSIACGSSGGSGNGRTTFKGAFADLDGSLIGVITFTVHTTSFSVRGTGGITEASLVAQVPATGSLIGWGNGGTASFSGTWDESLNTLNLSSSFGTITGGYFVALNQIGGDIAYTAGTSGIWTALKGGAGTAYCGQWDTGVAVQRFVFVVSGGVMRGYSNFGTSVEGTVNGNSLQYDANGFSGTGTFGASGASGTLNGSNWTASVCG